MELNIVILAAGLGTRMRSKRAKVLHQVGGLALVEHVVAAALDITAPERVVVVTGHQAAEVEEVLRPYGVRFVRQEPQNGTGHALVCCRHAVPDHQGLLMVLYGDTPLLSSGTLRLLRDAQEGSGAAATIITTALADPSGYGRMVLNDRGGVEAIVEHRDCTPAQREIGVINSGIYCFDAELLWRHLGELQPSSATGELYLTLMPEILARHRHRVASLLIRDATALLGINTRVELAQADRILRMRKTEELMLAGVTIEMPETVTIDAGVTAGEDTIIEPFVRLLGRTSIGAGCRIGAGSILDAAVIADGAVVQPYTLISGSHVEELAQVGPFARLRMGARVGKDARVGNFVELKKTDLGAGAKSQHLAYLGDATIGAGSNIGAGTITCNYDGVVKRETKIGEGTFIGSNTTLVAPVEIGADAYVGAGSVITEAVPSGALGLGRARQENKPGWMAKRRKKK